MNQREGPPIPPELEGLVRSMRDDTLEADRLAAIASKLSLNPPPGGPPGGNPLPRASPHAPGGVPWFGIAAAAVVTIGVGVGAWVMLGTTPENNVGSENETPRSIEPPVVAPVEASPAPEVVPTPARVDSPIAAPIAVELPTEPARPRPLRPAPADAVAEHALITSARRALEQNPAQSLALAEEHRSTFPNGTLAPEREFVAIRALVKLGRRDDARTRATQFRRRFPDSAYLSRIDALLEEGSPQ